MDLPAAQPAPPPLHTPTTFPLFPLLPAELRLQIWSHALPSPRTLKVKIDAYSSAHAELLGPFAPIPSIMHVCAESRSVGLSIYRLGLGPALDADGRNFYWDPRVDTVYLPPSAAWTNGVLGEFLGRGEGEGKNGIPENWVNDGFMRVVRHIALPLNVWLARGLYLEPEEGRWLMPWLRRLPELRSVTLLVEPYDQWMGMPDTRVVYYEPLNVPMSQLLGMKPLEIEVGVEEAWEGWVDKEMGNLIDDEGYGSEGDEKDRGNGKGKDEWYIPLVEVLVLGMKKYTPDMWCIKPRTNLDRDDVTGLWEARASREERIARRLRNRWPAELHAVSQWGRMGLEDEEEEGMDEGEGDETGEGEEESEEEEMEMDDDEDEDEDEEDDS
ncbi:hypothetical protein CJF31_00010147 [Rutstroemia sp. NJR-2017a BVV2]|nr:hypothetical protein CJF31_00009908 [Rutstroemia sp. NJR-2017a BVV2]PQE19720.1 hypothetical protein CJF31_00010147 [Rutstroemia sp. NJR-2017a BVV2]